MITLFVTFALFALAMAAMGIYGVMAYMVSERTAEISLRIALGAERWDVMRMILYKGGKLMLIGTGIGVVGALLMSRILSSLVVGVSERDPLTFVGGAALPGPSRADRHLRAGVPSYSSRPDAGHAYRVANRRPTPACGGR